jgi:hypothetical protein
MQMDFFKHDYTPTFDYLLDDAHGWKTTAVRPFGKLDFGHDLGSQPYLIPHLLGSHPLTPVT